MQQSTIKINVEIPLEVPMRWDENGRPVHPFALVAPYIDEFVRNTQVARMAVRGNYWRLGPPEGWKPEDAYEKHFFDQDKEDAMWEHIRERHAALERSHEEWVLEQDRQCHEFFGMSWHAFKCLSYERQCELRKEHNIEWDHAGEKWFKVKRVMK